MFLWNRGQTFAELELRNSFPICSLLRQWFRILRSPQERNWEPYPETRSKQFASRSELSCGQSSAGFRLFVFSLFVGIFNRLISLFVTTIKIGNTIRNIC